MKNVIQLRKTPIVAMLLLLLTWSFSTQAQIIPGNEDPDFQKLALNGAVRPTAILANGKILVGGNFTTYGVATVNRFMRLNVDGTLDTDFQAILGTGFNGIVNSILIQADGKILVGGNFSTFNDNPVNRLVRLNADGTLDSTFISLIGTGGSGVNSLEIDANGKIIVAGTFERYDGNLFYNNDNTNYISNIIRLNNDATLDDSFVTTTFGLSSGGITKTVVQPDGKILVIGEFSNYNQISRNKIARLNSDGSLDTDFVVGTSINGSPTGLILMPDGNILFSHLGTSYNGTTVNRVIKLNANGSLDTDFAPTFTTFANAYAQVDAIYLQADGKILAGGNFDQVNGNSGDFFKYRYLARLLPDGSLDTDFNLTSNSIQSRVFGINIQADDKIIAVTNNSIRRLLNEIGPALPTAPSNLVATAGNGEVTISFTAAGTNGGAAITNYEYTLNGGDNWIAFNPAVTTSPVTISGLTNGTSYTLQLRAVSDDGVGAASASVSFTPAILPTAPTSLSASVGDGKITLNFTPADINGGTAITNYQYTLNGGSTWISFNPAVTTSPVTITGLTNGTEYTIKLRALNAQGAGPESSSITATPAIVPTSPTILFTGSQDEGAVIYFVEAGTNGGSAVINYQYTVDGGLNWIPFSPSVTTSPITITGLTNGTPYSIGIRALNNEGFGEASDFVQVTPNNCGFTSGGVEPPVDANNVYQVSTFDHLLWITNNESSWDKEFKQVADINACATQNINNGFGWTPIGSSSTQIFTGTYDGNGYKISNLFINRPSSDFAFENNGYNIGLFGAATSATLRGITIENGFILGFQNVGGIAGYAENSDIIDCQFHGTVWARNGSLGGGIVGISINNVIDNVSSSGYAKGSGNVIGGLIGRMVLGTLRNSSTSMRVDGGQEIGGAVGSFSRGTLSKVFATGDVFGDSAEASDMKYGISVGGLVGYMTNNSSIEESYATGNVKADGDGAGGLVGVIDFSVGSITKSFASGNVHGATGVGGLIGVINTDDFTITDSYAVGNISGNNAIGGFIGFSGVYGPFIIDRVYAAGTIAGSGVAKGGIIGSLDNPDGGLSVSSSYWDTQLSGIATSAGGFGEGKTTAEMKTQGTFSGWDFTSSTGIWDINPIGYKSYPFFQGIMYDTPESLPEILPIPGLDVFEGPFIWYVKNDATGANNGSSWANAFTTIQAAVDAAGMGDIVVVAKGSGAYTVNSGNQVAIINESFNGAKLYGGYAGNEVLTIADLKLSERNLITNATIINGQSNRAGFVIRIAGSGDGGTNTDPDLEFETEIDGFEFTNTRWRSAGGGSGIVKIAIGFKGFDITLRNINVDLGDANFGGGIGFLGYSINQANLIYDHLKISRSSAAANVGGAIDFDLDDINGNLIVSNSQFSENLALRGGVFAIFSDSDSNFSYAFINSIFNGNGSDDGGVIYHRLRGGGEGQIINSTFYQNSASNGTEIIDTDPFYSPIRIANSIFVDALFFNNNLANRIDFESREMPDLLKDRLKRFEANGSGFRMEAASPIQIRYSLVSEANVNDLPATVSIDPADASSMLYGATAATFVDAATGNFNLAAGSPAINAGLNAALPAGFDKDFAGNDRIQGAAIDMGALETEFIVKIWYVKNDATGANDGSSWADAFTTIQAAVDAASEGEIIVVAKGTYTSSANEVVLIDPSKNFSGVKMYGGYAGNELLTGANLQLAARNFTTNASIIDGENARRGMLIHQFALAQHILNDQTIMDGFTITRGASTDGSGFYMAAQNSAEISPTFRNIKFIDNNADNGGGVLIDVQNVPKSEFTFDRVLFKSNSSISLGGGLILLFYNSNANCTITNSIFDDNSASTYSGAIYIENFGSGTLNVINSTFHNNRASVQGPIVFVNIAPSASPVSFVNSIFTNNQFGSTIGTGPPQAVQVSYSYVTETQLSLDAGSDITPGDGMVYGATAATFVDAATGNFNLATGSPAINAGLNSALPAGFDKDFGGNNRIKGGTVDLGAFEFGSAEFVWRSDAASNQDVTVPGNWDGGLPPAGADFRIPKGTGATPKYPVLNFDFEAGDITIEEDATLTIAPGNVLTFAAGKGAKGNGTGTGKIILKSDALGDGSIGELHATNFVDVPVVQERYVAEGNRAFRFLAHPYDGDIPISVLGSKIDITGVGGSANGFTTTATNAPSVFRFNPLAADGGSGEDAGWEAFTNATQLWKKHEGLRVLVRGPKGQASSLLDVSYNPDPVTLEWEGAINQGNQSIALSGVAVGGEFSDWNLVGNPFPSAINMRLVTAPVGVTTFAVWQPRAAYTGEFSLVPGAGRGGAYLIEPFAGGSPFVIPSGSAFFVRAGGASGSMTVPESAKVVSAPADFAAVLRSEGNGSKYGSNSMQLQLSVNGTFFDRVLVFMDESQNANRNEQDAAKLANPAVNFFTVSDDNWALAIDRRSYSTKEGENRIPLHILAPNFNYTLSLPDFDMEEGISLRLYDRFKDEYIKLDKNTSYTFEVTSDPKSKGHRFDIVMGVDVVTSIENKNSEFKTFLMPNPADEQVMLSVQRPDTEQSTGVRLVDMQGRVMHESQIAAESDGTYIIQLSGLPKGVYLVEVTHGNLREVKRLIVR
jgi:uncharacterized delta-60 repeat protein